MSEDSGPAPPGPGGLLAELRRRGVVRALVGYGLFAFAALQVAEPILHALHRPDGWLTGIVVLLGLGFPVVAAVSWAYDFTRRGLVRTAEPPPEAPGTPGQPGPGRLTLMAVVLASAALGAGLAWLALRPPALPVGADGRVTVAVADFANDTGDPDLDGLSGLLITSLEQSRRLRVMTRGRMLDLLRQAGRGEGSHIDEGLARDAGRRAGVRALLVASIRKLGDTYAVELRALDPEQDEYLFTLSERAPTKDGLLPLVDRLSDRVRERLRESSTEVTANEVNVARAVTSDLEAYRHYFRGMERLARLDDDGALLELRAALAIDPRFALAHIEVARWEEFMARDSRLSYELAGANTTSLPVKEGELLRASVASRDGRNDERVAILKSLADRFPDDRNVALATAAAMGCPDRMPYLQRALQLAPDWDRTRLWLVYCLSEQGHWAVPLPRPRPPRPSGHQPPAAPSSPSLGTSPAMWRDRSRRSAAPPRAATPGGPGVFSSPRSRPGATSPPLTPRPDSCPMTW